MQKSTHFESKIHEYLVPVLGECKNIKAIANHTGYICVTEEDVKKRFERNSVLLLEMIKEEPERLRWRVQLAQEYNSIKKWDELWQFCEENLEFTKKRNNAVDNRDIGTFYAGAVESLVALNDYAKAKENYDAAEKVKRDCLQKIIEQAKEYNASRFTCETADKIYTGSFSAAGAFLLREKDKV